MQALPPMIIILGPWPSVTSQSLSFLVVRKTEFTWESLRSPSETMISRISKSEVVLWSDAFPVCWLSHLATKAERAGFHLCLSCNPFPNDSDWSHSNLGTPTFPQGLTALIQLLAKRHSEFKSVPF